MVPRVKVCNRIRHMRPDPFSPQFSDELFLIGIRSVSLDLIEVQEFVSGPEWGGIAFFSGSVRPDDTDLGPVQALDYEVYEGVAEQKMREIAEETIVRYGAGRIAMIHRVGRCLPGEVSVIVAASAPHRAEAFDGCRYLIDELKRRVPIWKREIAERGERWVRCDHDSSGTASGEEKPPSGSSDGARDGC